jgi:hypothetical protein
MFIQNLQKINLNYKNGIPKNILNKENKKNMSTINQQISNVHVIKNLENILNTRPRNETSEERKNRKHCIKIYRKVINKYNL